MKTNIPISVESPVRSLNNKTENIEGRARAFNYAPFQKVYDADKVRGSMPREC